MEGRINGEWKAESRHEWVFSGWPGTISGLAQELVQGRQGFIIYIMQMNSLKVWLLNLLVSQNRNQVAKRTYEVDKIKWATIEQ